MTIKKSSLPEEVANLINKKIFDKGILLGDKLPNETEMMESFGVGRSTIREAIKLLVNGGIIEVRHGIGSFVKDCRSNREPVDVRIATASHQNIDEVRQWLEIKIVEKACLNVSEEHKVNMKDALDRRFTASKRNDIEECVDADLEFHSLIALASGNPVLHELYNITSGHLKKMYLINMNDSSIMLDTQTLHEGLFNAISKGSQIEAIKLIRKIINY